MPLQAAFFEQEITEEHVIGAAGLRVLPFATSHDAAASFGFRVEAPDGDALGYITDSGIVTSAAHAALRDVRILALESNHDERMLKNGDYPYVIKKRIASELGHLSNPQATEELAALIAESRAASLRTPETVVAMHISQNNNDYDLPRAALEEGLAIANGNARILCGYQGRLTSVKQRRHHASTAPVARFRPQQLPKTQKGPLLRAGLAIAYRATPFGDLGQALKLNPPAPGQR